MIWGLPLFWETSIYPIRYADLKARMIPPCIPLFPHHISHQICPSRSPYHFVPTTSEILFTLFTAWCLLLAIYFHHFHYISVGDYIPPKLDDSKTIGHLPSGNSAQPWNITIFIQTFYRSIFEIMMNYINWPFSIAMFNYQRL